jgi:hypothetical protein
VSGLDPTAALLNPKPRQIIRKVLLRQIAFLNHINPD